jgi:hypothetical protein
MRALLRRRSNGWNEEEEVRLGCSKVDAVCMNRAIAFLSKEPCGYSVVALK